MANTHPRRPSRRAGQSGLAPPPAHPQLSEEVLRDRQQALGDEGALDMPERD
jgi:hypothetical protein